MSTAFLVGVFASGLAPGTVPAPAPVTGHAVLRYTHLLQLNTSPGELIPVTPVRLPIIDGVLCSVDGVPSTTTPIPVQATDDPLLAQTGAIFAQVDLVFDGGSEPVQVLIALPGGATVDLATTARAGNPGAVFVSGLTPSQLDELGAALAQVEAARAGAQAAADQAQEAADEAVEITTAGLDPANAALINNAGSATAQALGSKYVTPEQLSAGLATKRSVTPSTLSVGVDLDTVVTPGAYILAGPATHTSAPLARAGFLEVEAAGSFRTQVYRAYGASNLAPQVFRRSCYLGVAAGVRSWSEWEEVRGTLGARPRGKIAFVGDSYTYGAQLTDLTQRWSTLLCASLGVSEQNLANSGSGYVNAGGSGNFVTQSLNVAADAQTVVICGGINDAPLNPTQSVLSDAVASIVANVRAASPTARIVILSPMWYQLNPSQALLLVESQLRVAAAAAGVRFVEGGPWLRFDRPEWSFSDGHPNAAGHTAIARWVLDQLLDKPDVGSTFGAFLRPGTADATFSGATKLAEGTLYVARRGWWRIRGVAVMYKAAIGWLWVEAAGFRSQVRFDVSNGDATPNAMQREIRFYHIGGDLPISVGYTPNGTATTSVQSNGQTGVWAEWVGYQ